MDSNLFDLTLRGAPALPYPDGPKVLAATARDVALVLSPQGWTVGLATVNSWIFTDPYGREARLWQDICGAWRLSVDPSFAQATLAILADLADHAAQGTSRGAGSTHLRAVAR
jgi:hypothetical protein